LNTLGREAEICGLTAPTQRRRREGQEAVRAQNPGPRYAHLERQEARHQRSVGCERPHDPAPQLGVPLNQQEKPGDRVGVANDTAMGNDVLPEITGGYCVDQGHSLTKRKGETLAGNRVEVA
jgi:hypothetical protein